MSDATREFFAELGRRGSDRLLKKTSGSIRFELEHEHGIDHWLVTIQNCEVRVTRDTGPADCVIRTEEAFFDRLIRGQEKVLPAWLRNEITSEGTFGFVVLLERIFCPSPGARHPREFARERGVRR